MKTVDLAAPLQGYICTEAISRVYLPAISSLAPNQGHVGNYLKTLQETFDEVVVPCVISPKLAAMLTRRGFMPETYWAPEADEHVECMVWRKPK